MVMSAAIKGGG